MNKNPLIIQEKNPPKGIVLRRLYNTPYLKHLIEFRTGVNFDAAYEKDAFGNYILTTSGQPLINFDVLCMMALEVMKNDQLKELIELSVKPQFADNLLWKIIKKLTKKDVVIPGITGHWTKEAIKSNIVTNVGHAGYAGQFGGTTSTPFTAMAYGTGTTAAAATDTALQTEVSRAASTITRVTTSVTNDTFQSVHTFTAAGTQAITEEGILDNNVSGGNLAAHNVFSAVNMISGDTLQFTHQIQS